MANASFTCVLDAWRDGQTLYGRMHYYRSGSFTYQDSSFPNPTMNLGGTVYTDTAFGDRVRAGITVGDVYSTTFSRTVAGTGDRTVTWSAGSGQRSDFAGTWSKTVNFPQTVTPPTGLSVTIAEVGARSAKFNVSISSYGNPSSASGRWIEAGIAGQNAWHSSSLRSANVQNVTSAQITVDNNSTKTTTLTIQPNTQYYYGGYAYNTQAEVSTIAGQLVTKCEAATIKFIKSGVHSATFGYVTKQDGGFYNKIIEYSLDNGTTWTTAKTVVGGSIESGELTIKNLALGNTYTALFRTRTAMGTTSTTSISFTTVATRDGYRLMGPVSGHATTTNILYGSGNMLGNLQLKGDTTQQTYTGANLVQITATSTTLNGVTFTVNNDGSVTASGTANATAIFVLGSVDFVNGTTYTLSGSAVGYDNSQARIWVNANSAFAAGNRLDSSNGIVRTRTATATVTGDVDIYVYNGVTINATFYPMIQIGSTATPYEPYVGGTASPNPDYPQPVQVVTGEQTVTITDGAEESQEYEVNLGKNLLGFPSGNFTNQGITWVRDPKTNTAVGSGTLSTTYSTAVVGESYDGGLPPGTYTFSIAEALPSPYRLELACHWTDGTRTNYGTTIGSKKRTIATTKWLDYAGVAIINGVASTQVSNLTIKNFQLERNGIDTTFSPYKEPVELCKIGDYQDYFHKSNGAWYLHKEINNITYNGTEDWIYYSNYNRVAVDRPADSIVFDSLAAQRIMRCTHMKVGDTENTDNAFNWGATKIFIRATNVTSSLSAWTTFLANNPITIYYPLETSKEIRIIDSGLISQLESLYDTNPAGSSVTVSVEGQLPIIPSYTLQTGVTKKINKLYGSVNNRARRVF